MAQKNSQRKTQMKLDFGQKRFYSIQCKKCGMVYLPNVKEDVSQHDRFHKSLSICSSKVSRWKSDKVVEEFFDGSRIILVSLQDFLQQQRFYGLRKVMEEELGKDSLSECPSDSQKTVFVYVNQNGILTGCCVAEQIDCGYRVLPDGDKENTASVLVSESSVNARVGVYRVWVSRKERGFGIGTALCDAVRQHLIYGLSVSRSQVAFTAPTLAGRKFAEKYCERRDILIYRK